MPDDNTTRWTVIVSKETDILVRSLLAQRGLKKGDLSKFIEEAVKWRVFDQTVTEARGKIADLMPDTVQNIVAKATESARKDMRKSLIKTTK